MIDPGGPRSRSNRHGAQGRKDGKFAKRNICRRFRLARIQPMREEGP